MIQFNIDKYYLHYQKKGAVSKVSLPPFTNSCSAFINKGDVILFKYSVALITVLWSIC
jgi:hypothetical protein